MQISVRAAALRTALERATDAVATVTETPVGLRIAVPVTSEHTIGQFQKALHAVKTGDNWGSATVSGVITVWAEVAEPGSAR